MAKSPTRAEGTVTPPDGDFVSPACIITARVAGFRRAGLAHGTDPTRYELGRFSEDEMMALVNEPNLVVVRAGDAPKRPGEAPASET